MKKFVVLLAVILAALQISGKEEVVLKQDALCATMVIQVLEARGGAVIRYDEYLIDAKKKDRSVNYNRMVRNRNNEPAFVIDLDLTKLTSRCEVGEKLYYWTRYNKNEEASVLFVYPIGVLTLKANGRDVRVKRYTVKKSTAEKYWQEQKEKPDRK